MKPYEIKRTREKIELIEALSKEVIGELKRYELIAQKLKLLSINDKELRFVLTGL